MLCKTLDDSAPLINLTRPITHRPIATRRIATASKNDLDEMSVPYIIIEFWGISPHLQYFVSFLSKF